MSLGFSITRNSALANDAPLVAFGFILPPGCLASRDTTPVDSSIVVPVAGATVPASSVHLTPVTPAGLAAAVMLVPDSSGIVAFCGATVTPEIGLSARSSRASMPAAIARQTAWLPAVFWSERIVGSLIRSAGAAVCFVSG